MRRVIVTWTAAFALLFAGFGASVVALNAELYSAHGFVREYFDALERRDSGAALDLPGVRTINDAATTLLTPSAMGRLGDVEVVSDTPQRDGTHLVTVEYTLPGDRAVEPVTSQSDFVVARDGTRLGLFPMWRFVTSPLNTVSVTVLNDTRFSVNDLDAETTDPNTPQTFLAFAPGLYVFDHESTHLTAPPVPTAVTSIGEIADVTVDVQANEEFVAEVQRSVSAYLEECTTQEVLMPTGCPFGQQLTSRVTTTPAWSMVQEPVVTVVPGTTPGTWAVPPTGALAHLTVDVRSLFDGRVSTFDEDVPFTVQYDVAIEPSDRLVITAVYE
jgi:hypothetical protein